MQVQVTLSCLSCSQIVQYQLVIDWDIRLRAHPSRHPGSGVVGEPLAWFTYISVRPVASVLPSAAPSAAQDCFPVPSTSYSQAMQSDQTYTLPCMILFNNVWWIVTK